MPISNNIYVTLQFGSEEVVNTHAVLRRWDESVSRARVSLEYDGDNYPFLANADMKAASTLYIYDTSHNQITKVGAGSISSGSSVPQINFNIPDDALTEARTLHCRVNIAPGGTVQSLWTQFFTIKVERSLDYVAYSINVEGKVSSSTIHYEMRRTDTLVLQDVLGEDITDAKNGDTILISGYEPIYMRPPVKA